MNDRFKTFSQLSASLFALGTLLAAAGSHATDIQELPLRASVLAKPNVIVGLDDSGSMDAELLLSGPKNAVAYFQRDSTVFYPGNLLRTSGQVRFDILFPTGTGPGNRVDIDNSWGPRALPPTTQFAWARSPDYNPIYYNTDKTYEPWSPSWVAGAVVTNYPDSNPAAAKTHPILGATTVALNADLNNTGATWRFTYTAGMVIPTGSSTFTCETGTVGALPYTVTTTNKACIAATPYYPATFWKKDAACAAPAVCATAWDGATLKRYEIKAGNSFPSGRSYADEMKNFANWFTYHRKRRLFTGAAIGEVLENMTGMNIGIVNFNNRTTPTMFDLDSTDMTKNRLAATTKFYIAESPSSTPTHQTVAYIANEFDTNVNIIKFACQRNAMFVITDGFANDALLAPAGAFSGYSPATYGGGAPYTARTASSLHDKALAYYTTRLRATVSPLPAGRVPVPEGVDPKLDKNPNLHINTYGFTLGIPGTIFTGVQADPYVSPPVWPAPVSDTATMIDDLWHATVNGRGQMYMATDVTGTRDSIQAGLLDILNAQGSQTGVAVSTVNLVRGDTLAYLASYNPSGWRGDVTANAIDQSTAVISEASTWSASTLLTARAWNTRVVASQTAAGTGVAFTEGGVGAVVNPGGVYGVTSEVMNYLRGERTHETTKFRKRTGLIGAIINSEPAISRADKVLYVASGEGMLHAFDLTPGADAGKELWAFVPRAVLPDIGATVDRGYSFKTQLDGSPVLGAITGKKILVAGMGAAGRSYYALDVTSPRGLTDATLAAKVMWEFPASGDGATQAKVGQTLGRPVIAKRPNGADVVLVTSGYNNSDNIGRLWMLNANTGAVIHEYTLPAGGSDAGLAHVSAFDEGNGTSKFAYGGDLQGNLWRFNLEVPAAPDKVAVLTGPGGQTQPVTVPPELTMIDNQRIVVVPTGRLLHINDGGNSAVQSLYVIKDGALLNPARGSLLPQIYNRAADTLTGDEVNWSLHRGWFMDLPAGEQGNTRPSITDEAISFVTNVNGGTDCSASSYLYLVNVKTGKKFDGATFVGSTLSTSYNSTAATALITKTGNIALVPRGFGGPSLAPRYAPRAGAAPGKGAWREVRRTP